MANAVMYDLCIVRYIRYTFSSISMWKLSIVFFIRIIEFDLDKFVIQFSSKFHALHSQQSLGCLEVFNFDLANIYFLELRRIQYNWTNWTFATYNNIFYWVDDSHIRTSVLIINSFTFQFDDFIRWLARSVVRYSLAVWFVFFCMNHNTFISNKLHEFK